MRICRLFPCIIFAILASCVDSESERRGYAEPGEVSGCSETARRTSAEPSVQPAPGVTEGFEELVSTRCRGAREIPVEEFIAFRLRPFGLEEPRHIPQNEEWSLVFDDFYDALYVRSLRLPADRVILNAADPDGAEYRWAYRLTEGNVRLIDRDDFFPDRIYDPPLISLAFSKHAAFRAGRWRFSVCYDDDAETIASREIDIFPLPLSVSKHDKPDPRGGVPWERLAVMAGESLYLWFNLPGTEEAGFVLYYYDEEDQSLPEMSYKPMKAFRMRTDEWGMYHDELFVGDDLPAGSYNFAFGERINELYLFRCRFDVVR